MSIFHRDYTPPTKLFVKPINLQKYMKYQIMGPEIPKVVNVEGGMLGLTPTLNYAKKNITNENKF
jgi:hypothetical protein